MLSLVLEKGYSLHAVCLASRWPGLPCPRLAEHLLSGPAQPAEAHRWAWTSALAKSRVRCCEKDGLAQRTAQHMFAQTSGISSHKNVMSGGVATAPGIATAQTRMTETRGRELCHIAKPDNEKGLYICGVCLLFRRLVSAKRG